MVDVIIIGAGTAGLSAAIYVQRAGKQALIFEGQSYGGQIINTLDVENYPGIAHISGFEFATNLYQQAIDLGAKVVFEEVLSLENHPEKKVVKTSENNYEAKSVIIATGMRRRELGLAQEEALKGKGVSYCATCDAAFFRGKEVVVNGGGNVAVEDAEFLSRFCEKVTIVHRRDEFRADEAELIKLRQKENIVYEMNSRVVELHGKDFLESVEIEDNQGNRKQIPAAAIFVAIGQIPLTDHFKDVVELDPWGYVIAKEDCQTSAEGIYVAGDCRTKEIRQLATAAADGAVAALAACK